MSSDETFLSSSSGQQTFLYDSVKNVELSSRNLSEEKKLRRAQTFRPLHSLRNSEQ